MRKTARDISSECINIVVPAAWGQLSREQFKLVCSILASDIYEDKKQIFIFLRLAGVEVLASSGSDKFLIKTKGKHGKIAVVLASDLSAAVDSVAFVNDVPALSELSECIKAIHKSAKSCDLSDMSFEEYLAMDSVYAGVLMTQKESMLDDLARLFAPSMSRVKDWHRSAVLLWFSAVKKYLHERFRNFFAVDANDVFASSNSMSPKDIRDGVDAQIRALTKGDITKESRILSMPVLRALTELDNLSREYKLLNQAQNK